MDLDSESERTIVKQSIQNRIPIPDSITKRPELRKGLEIFFFAFFDLDTERSNAMGLTRIPHSAIRQYAADYDFDYELTKDLLYLIPEMDKANLNRLDEKSK